MFCWISHWTCYNFYDLQHTFLADTNTNVDFRSFFKVSFCQITLQIFRYMNMVVFQIFGFYPSRRTKSRKYTSYPRHLLCANFICNSLKNSLNSDFLYYVPFDYYQLLSLRYPWPVCIKPFKLRNPIVVQNYRCTCRKIRQFGRNSLLQ